MAGLLSEVSSGPVALAASAPTTVLQLTAPTNQRTKIRRLSVSFDGTNGAASPVRVSLYRQTTAGIMTASPPVPVLLNAGLPESIQTAVTWKATTEPTYGDLIFDRNVPAYGGSLDVFFPFAQEPEIQGGGRLGVVCKAPAIVNVIVGIGWEE